MNFIKKYILSIFIGNLIPWAFLIYDEYFVEHIDEGFGFSFKLFFFAYLLTGFPITIGFQKLIIWLMSKLKNRIQKLILLPIGCTMIWLIIFTPIICIPYFSLKSILNGYLIFTFLFGMYFFPNIVTLYLINKEKVKKEVEEG